MGDANPLSAQQQIWFDAGINEFDSGRFWHAHEDWEDLWKSLKAQQAEPSFILGIQGMIQCAALLFQYERQNPRGIANMWSKVTEKLGTSDSPKVEELWGVNIVELLADLQPFVDDAAQKVPDWSLEAASVKITHN